MGVNDKAAKLFSSWKHSHLHKNTTLVRDESRVAFAEVTQDGTALAGDARRFPLQVAIYLIRTFPEPLHLRHNVKSLSKPRHAGRSRITTSPGEAQTLN